MKNENHGIFNGMDSIFDSVGIWKIYADTVISKSYPDIVYVYHDTVTILSDIIHNPLRKIFYLDPRIHSFNLGDINGDDLLDVAFISIQEKYWGIIYNMGDGLFSAPEYFNTMYAPTDIAVGDIDNDGRDDIVLAGIGGEILISLCKKTQNTSLCLF